jgi:hypothetical protein
MYQTITNSDFHKAFHDTGREDNFSYEGRNMLFEYLNENYPDMELDVIVLCCEFDESDWQTIADDYSIDLSDCEDDEERFNTVHHYLEDNTIVIGYDEDKDIIVYQAF